jgi:L-lactate dehydrogenase complex protein LldG
MSSRDRILQAVRANRPERRLLPELPVGALLPDDAVTRFAAMVQEVGGEVAVADSAASVEALLRARHPAAATVVSTVAEYPHGNRSIHPASTLDALEGIDLVVLRGALGVVENGAIWLAEEAMPHRAIPFVSEHLVLLLDADRLVADMHGAYAQLALEHESSGFGLFVSGPSKTADIERALVIGAQGPRSLLVVVTPS